MTSPANCVHTTRNVLSRILIRSNLLIHTIKYTQCSCLGRAPGLKNSRPACQQERATCTYNHHRTAPKLEDLYSTASCDAWIRHDCVGLGETQQNHFFCKLERSQEIVTGNNLLKPHCWLGTHGFHREKKHLNLMVGKTNSRLAMLLRKRKGKKMYRCAGPGGVVRVHLLCPGVLAVNRIVADVTFVGQRGLLLIPGFAEDHREPVGRDRVVYVPFPELG
jgi:hypothetical protein